MRQKLLARAGFAAFLFTGVVVAQTGRDSDGFQALVKEGDTHLAEHQLQAAAAAFQKAVDINPSSAKAHEGLGIALFQEIVAGNLRPSADSDVLERAENHLKQASDLAPSATLPLLQLSELEANLASRISDSAERSDRYRQAEDLLRRVISLKPPQADMYLRLANLERDQFAPAIDSAAARYAKDHGPLRDSDLRHSLQQDYGSLLDDAIANAQTASQMTSMNRQSAGIFLLLSRLLRERAVLRETADQYDADTHSAADAQRQFLTLGGHLGQTETEKR